MEEKKYENILMDDDELVGMFFKKQQTDIADNGFTERVVSRLPRRSLRLSDIWTAVCVVAGIVFCLLNRTISSVIGTMQGFLADFSTNGLFTSPLLNTVYMAMLILTIAGSLGLLSELKSEN